MEKAISFLFPTPIGEFRIPNTEQTNSELTQLILEKERAEPSETYANAGGWHSRQDLLEWPDPAVGVARQWMIEAVNQMIGATLQMMKNSGMAPRTPDVMLRMIAWANVSRFGHYHRMHNHPGSVWSGVYYVNSGEEIPAHPLSGVLELPDPRPFANMVPTPGDPFGQKALVKPEAGLIVVFPSWFQHTVHPYYGEGERISIAFNVSVSLPGNRPT